MLRSIVLVLISLLPIVSFAWQLEHDDLHTQVKDRSGSVLIKRFELPAKSELIVGKVTAHSVSIKTFNFFVIGDEPLSIQWAKQHVAYFKKNHALGFITNIDNENSLNQIEQETGLSLFMVSLDGLSKTLNISHYPFYVVQGFLSQ